MPSVNDILSADSRPEPDLRLRRLIIYGLLGMLMAGGGAFLVLRLTASPAVLLAVVQTLDVPALSALALLIGVAWLCSGLRIAEMSSALGYRLGWRQGTLVAMASEFGVAATPGGMGGTLIRLGLLRRAGLPLGHASGLILGDTLLDVAFFLLLLPLLPLGLYLDPRMAGLLRSLPAMPLVLGVMLLLILATGFYFAIRVRVLHVSAQTIRRWETPRRYRIPARLRMLSMQLNQTWREMRQGLRLLLALHPLRLLGVMAVTAVQWTCRWSVLPLILLQLGLPSNPIPLFVLQGLLLIGSMLVLLPGGGGAVELSAAWALQLLAPEDLSGPITLIWRLYTYHAYMIGGGLALLASVLWRHRLFPGSDYQRKPARKK